MHTERDRSPVAAGGNGKRVPICRTPLKSPNGFLNPGLCCEWKRYRPDGENTRCEPGRLAVRPGAVPADAPHQSRAFEHELVSVWSRLLRWPE
jgi:hypothetical protein